MLAVRKLKSAPLYWDNMVDSCPWGSFYCSSLNLDLIQKMIGCDTELLLAEFGSDPVGGLAYGVKEGPFGKVVNCLPYFGSYGEAVAVSECPPNTLEVLYKSLLEECQRIDALSLTVILSPFGNHGRHLTVRGILNPTFIDRRNCQMTYLPESEGCGDQDYRESVIKVFKPRVRTTVRKAGRLGFHFARAGSEEEVSEFHRLHVMAIGAKGGITKGEEFFRYALSLSLEEPDKAAVALLKDKETIAAGLVYFRYRDTTEYYVPVTNPDYSKVGPLKRLVYEVMVAEGSQGAKVFNFGGTWHSQKGVYQLKKGFGAQDRPYEYHTVFFRDLGAIKRLEPEGIVRSYPNFFVIPFSELEVTSG